MTLQIRVDQDGKLLTGAGGLLMTEPDDCCCEGGDSVCPLLVCAECPRYTVSAGGFSTDVNPDAFPFGPACRSPTGGSELWECQFVPPNPRAQPRDTWVSISRNTDGGFCPVPIAEQTPPPAPGFFGSVGCGSVLDNQGNPTGEKQWVIIASVTCWCFIEQSGLFNLFFRLTATAFAPINSSCPPKGSHAVAITTFSHFLNVVPPGVYLNLGWPSQITVS